MLGSIIGPINASVVNITLPTIAAFFGTDIPTVQWVSTIYLLTLSGLLLFCGRVADMVGYKKVYLFGLVGFAATSVLCGLSTTIYMLIFSRAVQGLAAASMSVSYAIITAAFPSNERGKALGINAVSIAAGLAAGQSLGGAIASLMDWRFIFFVNIPFVAVSFVWSSRIVREEKGVSGKLDMGGTVAAFASLSSFLLLVNYAQSLGLSLASLGLLAVSAASTLIFIWLESRAPQPMLNLGLFKDRTFLFANLSALLNFMSQYVMIFVTPFYLQRVLHYNAGGAGLIMASFPLAVLCVAPFSGVLSDRIGTRILACAGAALCAVSLFLMSTLESSAGSADVAWRLAIFGLGTGIFQSPNNSAVMGSAPRPYLGVASGILSTMRNVGMALGISFGGIMLSSLVAQSVLQRTYLEGVDAQSFLAGLKYAYLVAAILTSIASLTSLVKNRKGQPTS